MLLKGGGVLSCNAAVTESSSNSLLSSFIRRPSRNAAVWFNSFGRTPMPHLLRVTSGATGERQCKQQKPILADRLQLGSFAEDGLSYKEKFMVRCHEVGINKTASVQTIANLLQDVSCNHAQNIAFSTDGFGTTITMRKLHLIWVIARMHIEIYKYPAWSDVVEIETWYQEEGRSGFRRDWIIKDYAAGEIIGRATSKWVMMNQKTRRLQKVTDDVRDEILSYSPKTLRLAFPEENNASLKKIAKLNDPAEHSKLGFLTS